MEQQTRDHIETARYLQRFARSLLDPSDGPQVLAGRYEWATVGAFYAAVRYIHAYLWERHRYYPRSHPARANRMQHDPVLRQCRDACLRLLDRSMKARYERLYVVQVALVRDLFEVDLAHVEATVMAAI